MVEEDGWLRERVDPAGQPTRIVTAIDAPRFNRLWVDVVSTSGEWVSAAIGKTAPARYLRLAGVCVVGCIVYEA